MNSTVNDWVALMLLLWDSVRKSRSPFIAVVGSLLGVEPKKPRDL